MTTEEAIKMLTAKLECMTREISGCDQHCNNRECEECSLNYTQGNMGEQKEYLKMSIKALEREKRIEDILSNINPDCVYIDTDSIKFKEDKA